MNELQRVSIGEHYADKTTGLVGAVVSVNVGDGGWNGHYRIETHGMTDDDVLAEINDVLLHHQAKAARLTGFAGLDRSLKFAGQAFTIVNLTLAERGTDVELRIRIEDSNGVTVGKEFGGVYPAVSDVPSDAEIRQMATDYLEGLVGVHAAVQAKAATLANLLAPLSGPMNDLLKGVG